MNDFKIFKISYYHKEGYGGEHIGRIIVMMEQLNKLLPKKETLVTLYCKWNYWSMVLSFLQFDGIVIFKIVFYLQDYKKTRRSMSVNEPR